MKYILLIVLCLPALVFGKHKYANACDSLNKTIFIPNVSQSQLMVNTLKQLQSLRLVNYKEKFSAVQLNDSIIVCKGTIELHKTGAPKTDPVYGKYKVISTCDGFVDFNLTMTISDGKLVYDVQNATQYGSRAQIGAICKDDRNYIMYINGVKIMFKRRIDSLIKDILVSYHLPE